VGRADEATEGGPGSLSRSSGARDLVARQKRPSEIHLMESMSDTELEILRGLSAERKLAVMQSLIQQAFDLKEAWIKSQAPELGREDILARVREQIAGAGS